MLIYNVLISLLKTVLAQGKRILNIPIFGVCLPPFGVSSGTP